MASPTKIVETIRGRKRAKRLESRIKRIRKENMKRAEATPAELRRFIPNIVAER